MCGKKFKGKTSDRYCGKIRDKNSCKYKAKLEKLKKFRKQHRKELREKQKAYRESPKTRDRVLEAKRKYNKDYRLRLRFQVFQRDSFTCQYCGRKAPEVILEIDHIHPRSKGGKSNPDNYITACRECNIGKGDAILSEFKA